MNTAARHGPAPSPAAWLAEHHGLRVAASRCVARLDCEIHRLRLAAGRDRTGDLALRIYPARIVDATAIADEVTWLAALGDAGLHVPAPRLGLDGQFVHRWPDSRLAVVLSWVDGRLLDKALRPQHFARVGRLAGAMHKVAEALLAQGRIAGTRPGDAPDLAAWAEGRRAPHPALPATAQHRAEAAARRLTVELAAFPRDRSTWGFIHSDLHLWNLLFKGHGDQAVAGAIDFSECGLGHHAQDLASVLHWVKHPVVGNHDHRPLYPRHSAALLEGYAAVRPLPQDVERQIDAYIELRMINAIEWVLDTWPSVDERPWGRAFLQRAGEFFSD